MRVLEEIGIAFNSDKAIDLLEAGRRQGRPRDAAGQAAVGARRALSRDGAAGASCWRVATRGTTAIWTTTSRSSSATDGTGTYMYDDVTGRRWEGTQDDLRDVIRLFEGLDEIDMNWCSICPRDVDPATLGPAHGGDRPDRERQAPAGRGAPSRAGAGLRRDARDLRRRVAARATHLLGDQLHDRAAAARQGDDRGRHGAGPGGRADLRACPCR